ncbi:MAG: hypothetical protein ACI9J3_000882, partial [Parvicellaceae bacterium]
ASRTTLALNDELNFLLVFFIFVRVNLNLNPCPNFGEYYTTMTLIRFLLGLY